MKTTPGYRKALANSKRNTAHLKALTKEQYDALPEDVRKVYIHVTQGVPMDTEEKKRIVSNYSEYFDWKPAKTFGEKLKSSLRRKGVSNG